MLSGECRFFTDVTVSTSHFLNDRCLVLVASFKNYHYEEESRHLLLNAQIKAADDDEKEAFKVR